MSLFWIDSKDVQHRIEYMSDKYLLNCIRFVENKIEQNPNYRPTPAYYNLIKEYDRRIDENI